MLFGQRSRSGFATRSERTQTREQYLQWMRRTAMRLSPAFIDKAIGGMKRRCRLLFVAKGGLFEEGADWSGVVYRRLQYASLHYCPQSSVEKYEA